jgi:hypothetical protein
MISHPALGQAVAVVLSDLAVTGSVVWAAQMDRYRASLFTGSSR